MSVAYIGLEGFYSNLLPPDGGLIQWYSSCYTAPASYIEWENLIKTFSNQ